MASLKFSDLVRSRPQARSGREDVNKPTPGPENRF
jgi:hypothetical protein